MKTLYQKPFFGSSYSLDEVYFTGRNHAYGAYLLRKKSNKYLIVSFLITTAMVASVSIPMLIKSNTAVPVFNEKPLVISTLNMDDQQVLPPPPPAKPEVPKELIKQAQFGAPEIVNSEKARQDPGILTNVPISDVNVTGSNVQYLDTSKIETDDIDLSKPFLKVEEDATFQGGTINDFRLWVGKHIVFPENASEMDISGKVYIQFVVNTLGKVEDLKLLKGVDPVLDQEALRVIAASPLWGPAKQRGIKVKQQFSIPIAFQLRKSI